MAEKDEGNGGREEEHSEWQNFQSLLKQVLSAPKEKIDERRAEHERDREKGRRAG